MDTWSSEDSGSANGVVLASQFLECGFGSISFPPSYFLRRGSTQCPSNKVHSRVSFSFASKNLDWCNEGNVHFMEEKTILDGNLFTDLDR